MPHANRPTDSPWRARRRSSLSVKIAFPVVIMLAVVITGLIVYSAAKDGFRENLLLNSDLVKRVDARVYLLVFALGMLALAVGLALAFYITGPLRQLAHRAVSAMTHPVEEKPAHEESTRVEEVFGDIGTALERMVGSVGSLALDSITLDSLSGGILTISQDGVITSFNPQAEAILGHPAEDVKGNHWERVFPEHPTNMGFRRLVREGFGQGAAVSSREVAVLGRGQRELLVGASISPLRDAEGMSLGLVLSFKDLAAVKQAQAQMQRADQLATLGSFAAGMAHEIRNPLASLQGLVELLLEDVPADDPKHAYLTTIHRNLTRLTGLTEDLLSLAHPGGTRLEPADVNRVVEEAIQLAQHEHREKPVHLEMRFAGNLPLLDMDQEKLSRAFLNILRNAYQVTPERGTVRIQTSVVDDPGQPPGHRKTVVVSIANTGSYIPPEQRQRLFNPFFTTRERGTGLGLAITYQIVLAHQGQIRVESDPAQGTCFQVLLPTETRDREST